MDDQSLLRRRRIVFGAVVLVIFALILMLILHFSGGGTQNNGVINPNKDDFVGADDGAGDGKNFAVFYKSGDLYAKIDHNDDVLTSIQEDVMLFARTTRAEFKDPTVLVGFTFDKGSKKKGEVYVYTGHFYGLDDKIEIRLTPHERGVYTLSITNLVDGANIDDKLSLNGKRNAYIKTLPIEKDRYSIRYQLPMDRIVVSFYDGYSIGDVNEAAASIEAGLGTTETKDVVYNLNRIGLVSLEAVRQNLVTPLPQP